MTKEDTIYFSDIIRTKGKIFCEKCRFYKEMKPNFPGFIFARETEFCIHPSNLRIENQYDSPRRYFLDYPKNLNKNNDCKNFCPKWKWWRKK